MEEETYDRADLERLVDWLIEFPPNENAGFLRYSVCGLYVSPAVIEQAYNERLEKMLQLPSCGS